MVKNAISYGGSLILIFLISFHNEEVFWLAYIFKCIPDKN